MCDCASLKNRPSPHDLVGEVLTRWPGSAAVFLRYGMACPGCVMAPMMTFEEAAAAYGIDPACLGAEIVLTTAFPCPT
jgi:hybrid cluster-associated redox disulfide protein